MINFSKILDRLNAIINKEEERPEDFKLQGKKVIDLSVHNGQVDFKKVKEDGVYGLIQRLGYGDSFIDERADFNIKEAYANGLKIGAYWFIYAYTAEYALVEADFFNSQLQKYKDMISLPVFADYEYDSESYAEKKGVKIDNNLRSQIVSAFLERLKSYGWQVGNYANKDYIDYKFDEKVKEYPLWYADWRAIPDYELVEKSILWQYTSQGQVVGIEGAVDISELRK